MFKVNNKKLRPFQRLKPVLNFTQMKNEQVKIIKL